MATLYQQNFAGFANGTSIDAAPNFKFWSHDAFTTRSWTVQTPGADHQALLNLNAGGVGNWSFAPYQGATFFDFDFSANVWLNAGSANDTGIYFRGSTETDGNWPNGYSFGYIDTATPNAVRVLKYTKAGGPSVLVASTPIAGFVDGSTLRVVAIGSKFICYVAGVQVITFTDASFTSGGVGLQSRADSVIDGTPGWTGLVVNDFGNQRRRGRS